MDEGAVVFEAAGEGAAVDEVEFLAVDPFVFCVVDFETIVGWDVVGFVRGDSVEGRDCALVWLDWTEVCTENTASGVFLGCGTR